MGKTEELEKLNRTVKDGEIRLRTIQTNVEILTKEINILLQLEAELEENVRCLKKKNIIAIATEFKKAKEDLKKTKIRLICAKNEVEAFNKAEKEVDKAIKLANEGIQKLKATDDNNVFHGSFGRKNGQK